MRLPSVDRLRSIAIFVLTAGPAAAFACGGVAEPGTSSGSSGSSGTTDDAKSSGGSQGSSGASGSSGSSGSQVPCEGYVPEQRTTFEPIKTTCDVDAGPSDGGCIDLPCFQICANLIPNLPGALTLSTCSIVDGDAGEKVAKCEYRGPPCGRRPEGIALLHSPLDGIGAWLAASAYLEEASIVAFGTLARELEAHGAPRALVNRAREAARDEARHALAMRRLARRAGRAVTRPEPSPARIRSIEEIAIENAAEGCVRETYGALLATWQAMTAEDAEVRATMALIADEETAHAELAWDVRTFFEELLDEDARGRVNDAAAATLLSLATELETEPQRLLVQELGVPTAGQARLLLRELFLPYPIAA